MSTQTHVATKLTFKTPLTIKFFPDHSEERTGNNRGELAAAGEPLHPALQPSLERTRAVSGDALRGGGEESQTPRTLRPRQCDRKCRGQRYPGTE
jgi:hypothetical protein